MKTSAIIQARMASSRLPGKVMMKVDDRHSVLHCVLTQLQESKFLDQIIVATTNIHEDDQIVEFLEKENVSIFRGHPSDVLARYYQCAKKFSCSTIVRITADCPLIDPKIVDQVVQKYYSGNFEYVTNKLPRTAPTFPQGTETEVFSFQALKQAWKEAKKPSEREHVTPYFYNNSDKFKIFSLTHSPNLSHLRWTVDREEDLKLVQLISSKIKKRPILMTDILDLLSREPELVNINRNHIINEGYLKSLKEDEEFMKSKK